MASAVRQITSVGGDIRKIARLLQKKAPPGHMLAYINQEEADLLKARGGSGEPHEDTGIPSFEDYDLPPDTGESEMGPPESAAPSGPTQTAKPAGSEYGGFDVAPSGATAVGEGYAGPITATSTESPYALQTPRQLGSFPGGSAPPTPSSLQPSGDKDLLGRLSEKTGLKEETLKNLGISSLQGLYGVYAANKAQQAGQAGKEELSALAAPYKAQAQDLIAKSQRGELTPVGQQQLQAVQAQAAQGAERRGGVGAQQSMAQVEAFRQQLLQSQYDYGLKLSGIADNIITGAIKTGLQADQYVSNLTSSYFGNIARIMAGVEDKKPTTGA